MLTHFYSYWSAMVDCYKITPVNIRYLDSYWISMINSLYDVCYWWPTYRYKRCQFVGRWSCLWWRTPCIWSCLKPCDCWGTLACHRQTNSCWRGSWAQKWYSALLLDIYYRYNFKIKWSYYDLTKNGKIKGRQTIIHEAFLINDRKMQKI